MRGIPSRSKFVYVVKKAEAPDWLSSYTTTGLADLCADFDANEVNEVDFESE